MRYSSDGRVRQQARFLRRQFLQDCDLPFSDVLSEGIVAQALTSVGACWTDRIYSPLVTLWVFLGQVLSADASCRAAVARLIAHRLSQGQGSCSAKTSAYCQARKRLPEKFFSTVACLVGRALEAKVDRPGCGKVGASTDRVRRKLGCLKIATIVEAARLGLDIETIAERTKIPSESVTDVFRIWHPGS